MRGEIPSQRYGDCQALVCDEDGNVLTRDDGADVYDDGLECTADVCVGGAPVNMPLPNGGAQQYPGGILYCYDGALFECGVFSECPPPLLCKPLVGQTIDHGGYCVPSSCANNVRDVSEAGVDCGGHCKIPCADGSACDQDVDCMSSRCSGTPLRCQAPTCSDDRRNGDETGVDCGGASPCGPCDSGGGCRAHEDCASLVCRAGKCEPPLCTDAVQNGDEQGVDCGGSRCPPCAG